MVKEVKFMSTVIDRKRAREFESMIEHLNSVPGDRQIRMEASQLLSLLSVMRDYTVMTHLSGAEAEIATAIHNLVDFVEEGSYINSNKRMLKTTELAKIFGVSVTAINKWIKEGRFVGYKRIPSQHAQIPTFTPFLLRNGRVVQLGKLIAEYQNKQTTFADDDNRHLLMQELNQLQNKYNAKTFEQAFGSGPTAEQESDASWWIFYEKKLSELNG
jgi:hypothetical protein